MIKNRNICGALTLIALAACASPKAPQYRTPDSTDVSAARVCSEHGYRYAARVDARTVWCMHVDQLNEAMDVEDVLAETGAK